MDWVTGACMLVRKEAIKKAGMLDEELFMYGEEVEWCYRIKRADFEVQYFPEAKVFHHKGKSSKADKNAGIIDEFLAILYFFKKHKPLWQQYLVKLILKFGALLRIILFGIIVKNSQKEGFYAKAYKMVR